MPLLGTRGAASAKAFGLTAGGGPVSYLYVAMQNGSLVVVNVATPSAMSVANTVSSFFTNVVNISAIDETGKIYYVGTDNGTSSGNLLYSYNLATPLNPTLINSANAGASPQSIAIARPQGKVYLNTFRSSVSNFVSYTSTNGTLSAGSFRSSSSDQWIAYFSLIPVCGFARSNRAGTFYPLPTPTSVYEFTLSYAASFIDLVAANVTISGSNAYGFALSSLSGITAFSYLGDTSVSNVASVESATNLPSPRNIVFRKANTTCYVNGQNYVSAYNQALSFRSKYNVPDATNLCAPVLSTDEKTLFMIDYNGTSSRVVAIDIQDSTNMSLVGTLTLSNPGTEKGALAVFTPT